MSRSRHGNSGLSGGRFLQIEEAAQGLGLLEADVCIAFTEIYSEVGAYSLAVLVTEGCASIA